MGEEICVVGCGAVGCFIAGLLYKALGRPIWVIVRRSEHARALREGLTVSGLVEVRARVEPSLPGQLPGGSCGLSIVAVKSYDTVPAVDEALRVSRTVGVAQNGFGGLEYVYEKRGVPLGVLLDYGIVRVSDNTVEVRGEGQFIIGPYMGLGGEWARRLSGLLERAGARVSLVDDIEPYRWAKAAVNAGINGVTAVLGSVNGVIVDNPYAREVAVRASREVASVAERLGIALPWDPVEYMLDVARRTRRNRSSMLQDVEAGRRTEADAIYGWVVDRARGLGVRVPTIETLYILVRALEGLGGRRCSVRR